MKKAGTNRVADRIRSVFVGRWQPLHDGHKALVQTALDAGHEVIVGIRDTELSPQNPYSVAERRAMVEAAFPAAQIFVIPDFDEICYGRKVGYSFREIHLDGEVEAVSGTATRKALEEQRGVTVWFTGLPCSGKTTIANLVAENLRERGLVVEQLDGDTVRRSLTSDLGFSKADRDENIERVTFVARLLTRSGAIVLCSFISPYRERRLKSRWEIGDFVEVFVRCPVAECALRDEKGMYAKAIAGEIENFTGVSAPYEEPKWPEIVCDTQLETPEESAAKVLGYLGRAGYG